MFVTPPSRAKWLKAASSRLSSIAEDGYAEAVCFLCHVLTLSAASLYAHLDAHLSEAEGRWLEKLITLRLQGRPVAYLIGKKAFWDETFLVSPAVLIPRPETEHLVEIALTALSEKPKGSTLIDMGCGCGTLGLTLAKARPDLKIICTDISRPALALARRNAQRFNLGHCVEFLQGSWFEALHSTRHLQSKISMIVSNPPYLTDEALYAAGNGLAYEPKHALSSGPTGLEAIKALISYSPAWLENQGVLAIEHGSAQHLQVSRLMHQKGFSEIKTYADYADHPRITLGKIKQ